MKTAIILGAGASASEGAPIQSSLFKEYFKLLRKRKSTKINVHENQIIKFFNLIFDIDVVNSNLDEVFFPTFEEALGVLDLADLKDESFKDFSNINFDANSGSIKFLRLYLVFLMADILNDSLDNGKGIHKMLINNLKKELRLKNTIFLTTNYDLLCDNALLSIYPDDKVDYGVDFVNYKKRSFQKPDKESIKYFKLHGSLNWLYCPTCNSLRITPQQKGVYAIIVNPESSYCKKCKTIYSPIIVPPTFYKDLSKVFLSQVWNNAESELLDVEHLVFCGYSFPDADIHIKYLIKRIQKNRKKENKMKITVINNHQGKSQTAKIEEKQRYIRFLGPKVNYTSLSFEDFANKPLSVIK